MLAFFIYSPRLWRCTTPSRMVSASLSPSSGWDLGIHGMVVGAMQNRSGEIEREVARLREAVYEKPKRLELDEDGELIDDEYEYLSADKRGQDSV
ncbi:MAG: hypothetical protein U0703_27330 [Anaerolineae bacterium]